MSFFTPFAFIKTEVSAVVDQDVTNFFNRVTANGGSLTSTEESAIATLVADLKADNIWDDCQAIYPCVGASAAATQVNLKNTGSFELSFSGGITYSSDGFKTNGSNGFANTSWAASTAAGQNDIHIGIMLFENQSANGIAIGSNDGSTSLNIYPRYNGSQIYGRINSAGDGPTVTGVTTSKHLYLLSRILSNESALYLDGTEYNLSTNSNGVAVGDVNIGRNAIDGNQYFPTACCFATLGNGFSDTQATDYTTAIQAFQTTLGGNRPF
jgi:hypothetical protein